MEHDPMCKHRVLVTDFSTFEVETCDCERVRKIRADERRQVVLDHESGIVYRDIIEAEVRERIAQEIEEKADDWADWDTIAKTEGDMLAIRDLVKDALHDAARIARKSDG